MTSPSEHRPRIGCLGVGWIGRHRMECVVDSEAADVVAVLDPSAEAVDEARECAPDARAVSSFDEMLSLDLDGVMIATPSAMHAEQAVQTLRSDVAVFCQKPLARTAREAAAVIEAAREADRLLGVDFSYRHTDAMQAIIDRIAAGELGDVYAIDLVFHNAYGPDKDWFYDVSRAGGGCVMDLGIHLIDLALWAMDWPEVVSVDSQCYLDGRRIDVGEDQRCEDYATATMELEDGVTVRLACSWNLSAGRDAVIGAEFYGTRGGAAMRNVDGSFYDFVAERYDGTATETLVEPPDAWGGRAAVAWAEDLGRDPSYDPQVAHVVEVAHTLDRVYGRSRK